MKKIFSIIFPLLPFLYVLQLSEYRTGYYLKTIFKNFHRRDWQKRDKLVSTAKIKLIALLTSALTLFLIGIAVTHHAPGYAILSIIVIFYATPLLIALANILVLPFDRLMKYITIQKATTKLKSMPKTKIIGITGSFGKSTTRQFIYELLKTTYNVITPSKNINTDIGIAREILALKDAPDYMVLEMGAYRKGEIKKICRMASPDVSIITGIGSQHIEQFGSLENIYEGKSEIITYAKTNAIVFLNDAIPSPALAVFKRCAKNKDTRYYNVSTLPFPPSTATLLPGKHLVTDLAGAVAVATHLGVPLSILEKIIPTLTPLPRRMEVKKVGRVTIVDDNYNISPESAHAALKTVKEMAGNNRVVVVTAGIVEQGAQAQSANQAWGEKLAHSANLVILAQSVYSADVLKGIQSIAPDLPVKTSSSPSETQEILHQELRSGDVILLQNELPDIYH